MDLREKLNTVPKNKTRELPPLRSKAPLQSTTP